MTPKVCAIPGCANDATSSHTGRCEVHAPPPRWATSNRRDALDKRRWSLVRRKVLRRDKGMCRFCAMPASTVDHRLPLAWGGAPFEQANLQSMCEECHRMKTDEEGVLGRKLGRAEVGREAVTAHVTRWTP